MAEDQTNSIVESGDVLGTGFSSTTDNNLRRISSDVSSINESTSNMEKTLLKLLSNNTGSNRQNFTSNFDSGSSKIPKAEKRKKSNLKSEDLFDKADKGSLLDAFDGIEEAFCEYIGLPYVGDDIQKQMKSASNRVASKLADALGVSVDEMPKTIAKAMTTESLNNLSTDSFIGKALNNYSKKVKSRLEDLQTDAYVKLGDAWNNSISNISNEDLKLKLDFDEIFGSLFGIEPSDINGNAKKSSNESEVEKLTSVLSDKMDIQWDPLFSYMDGFLVELQMYDGDINSLTSRFDNATFSDYMSSNDGSVIGEGLKDTAKDVVTDKIGDAAKKAGMDVAGKGLLEAGSAALATGDIAAVGSALSGVGSAALALGPELLALAPELLLVVGAVALVDAVFGDLFDSVGEFVGSIGNVVDSLETASKQYKTTSKENLDAQEKRFQQDIETYIKYPFEILEESAEEVRSTWSEVISTINQTQNYTKSDLQDLMSAYSARLQEEGLSSSIGTTDITSKLQSILDAGLSGDVAEEFAYISTVLENAVPTENWDSYAQSYASMVSTFVSQGYSTSAALSAANTQLTTFASNILNAKDVSDGLTTSLTNVSDMFDSIVQITQTAGGSDTSSLSSALSITQAIAGQISSSVGNDLVSQIVQAAVGGNSDELVALRSMAGTGAANTSFLKALYANPNSVLATMFENLSAMIDKSKDNYMEVAYSLADTFGISADALVRIDWDKLVSELRSNSSSTSNINNAVSLLASGESTTNAESQKLAQINEYLLDQGLSYIIDNDAAWQVQQHLWEQEIAEQLTESTFAVSIQESQWELITSFKNLLTDILRAIPGVGLFLGAVDTIDAINDLSNYTSDIAEMIDAGKVGSGNASQYHDLTTYDVGSLIKEYDSKSTVDLFKNNYNSASGSWASNTSSSSGKYSWSDTGKSALTQLANYNSNSSSSTDTGSTNVSEVIQSNTTEAFNSWLSSMESAAKGGTSYSDWYASAKDYGFSDAASAADYYGYSTTDLEDQYRSYQVDSAVEYENSRVLAEDAFWLAATTWYNEIYPTDRDAWLVKYDETWTAWNEKFDLAVLNWTTLYTETMTAFQEHLDEKYSDWMDNYLEQEDITHTKQQYLNKSFSDNFVNDFLYEWKDYYIGEHTHYVEGTGYERSLGTINKEKTDTGEAVLALANQLMENYEDLADPQVQTNLLLAKIVELLQAIFNNQNAGSGLTLPTALSALGLNITNSSSS